MGHRRIPCRRRQSASCFLTVHVHCEKSFLRLFCLVILGPKAAAETEFLNNTDGVVCSFHEQKVER